ncbi:hypothetical protein GCM10020227_19840 [Streptomyces flavovirens]
MSVLTREEAQTRAQQLIDVHRYTVDLDVTTGEDTFTSRTTIRFTTRTPVTPRRTQPETLHALTLDGQPLDPHHLDDNRYPLHHLTAGPHELTVHATMRYSRTGEGMHRFTDPADGETYSTPSSSSTTSSASSPPSTSPTSRPSSTSPSPHPATGPPRQQHRRTDRGRPLDARHHPTRLHLPRRRRAGPWHYRHHPPRRHPLRHPLPPLPRPHLDTDADEILTLTRALYDRYHEKFDEPYPFDSYDQAFVPEFNAGAMENPGLVTFRDEFIYRSAVTDTERQTRAMVIAHEMAHMWFGDLVTLTWWDDIWLNESFAEYMGYQTLTEATRFTDTWTDFGVSRKGWGYDADQRPSTHPVAPDAVPDTASALLNFDGISYAKGASALRQLVTWLGEKDFLAGINTHFAGTSSPTPPSPTSSTASPPPPTATSTPGPPTGSAPPAADISPPTSRTRPPMEPHRRPRRETAPTASP